MTWDILTTVQIITILLALAAVIGLIVAVTFLTRLVTDISTNVYRMTSWTSRCLTVFDEMNRIHGERPEGFSEPSRTDQETLAALRKLLREG